MSKSNRKARKMFAPSAAQWDPETISDETAAPEHKDRIQFWSVGGSMSIVTVAKAKELVRNRYAFVGGPLFINQTMRWEAFFMRLTGFGDETQSAGSQEIIAPDREEATRKAEAVAKRRGWILDSVDAQDEDE